MGHLCVKVKKENAEKTRKELQKLCILDHSFSPKAIGNFVYFPIKKETKTHYVTEAVGLKTTKIKPKTIEEALQKMGMKPFGITRSFDIIGDVVIIDIPNEIKNCEKKVAQALMEVHPNIKTVAKKAGPISGVYRLRKLKIIAGEKRTETLHKESGCLFKLDIAKVYFSPRLVFERQRIASLVRKNESVFVPFAGVGPFPIIIAKKNPTAKVYANELNPVAFKYLKENIRMNKVNVTPIFGDVRKVAKKMNEKFDRIVMPLPMGADKFLDVAFSLAKKNCFVHIYLFVKNKEEAERLVEDFAKKMKGKAKILATRITREYAPKIVEVVVDFKLS